ncbi:MAG: hypothetical protein GX801_05430 [Fibrobacter sp.]|nr:hypothetical protein [Fibrobacter sp.]
MILAVVPSEIEFAQLAPAIEQCGWQGRQIGVGIYDSARGLLAFLEQSVGNKEQNGGILQQNISAVLLMGIAGAYPESGLNIGEIVRVDSALLGDIGARAASGEKIPGTQIGASNKKQKSSPLSQAPGVLLEKLTSLASATSLTVVSATGTAQEAQERYAQDAPTIEEMEGCLLALYCEFYKIPFYHVRAISNMVGPRDLKSWRMDLALANLNLWIRGEWHG